MSTQVNIRLDEDLLKEVDALAKVLHVTRTEWLRMKISRDIKEEALDLREVIAVEYSKGRINDDELKDLLGADADDVRFIIANIRKGREMIDEMIKKGDL